MASVAATVGSLLVGGSFPYTGQISERLSQTSPLASWEQGGRAAAAAPEIHNSGEYASYAYGEVTPTTSQSVDVSSTIRFTRWRVLIHLLSEDGRWLLGLGPSFAGPSVDGGILRILVETGVLGFIGWLALVFAFWRRMGPAGRASLIALIVGSLFIDLTSAMRVMMVAFLLFAVSIIDREAADVTAR